MPELFHRPDPSVAWGPLRTPTLPPAESTNCGVFGSSHFVIIDAGATLESERLRILDMIEARRKQGQTLQALLLTHHHPDHISAMEFLRAQCKVPMYAHRDCEALLKFSVDHYVKEGDVIELGNQERIHVHESPGHAQGHVIYVHEQSRWCYAGDLVIEKGSVLIDERDGGCVVQYLNSLRKIKALCGPGKPIEVLLPGHGQPITNTTQRIDELISHRMYREKQLLDLLATRPRHLDEVIKTIYAGKPAGILPFARATIHSHMRKLVSESRVQPMSGQSWQLSPRASASASVC